MARIERLLDRVGARERSVHEVMAAAAQDHVRLTALTADLTTLHAEREQLEAAWLTAADLAG